MKLHLFRGKRYTQVEKARQKAHSFFITLSVSGLDYSHIYTPSGKKYAEGTNNSFGICFPGYIIDFSYNSSRENYVLACETEGIYHEDNMLFPVMEHDGMKIPLLKGRRLTCGETLALRNIFERIIALKDSPLPGNIFMAEQLAISLLGELAVKDELTTDPEYPDPPAKKLKQMIDRDIRFEVSLKDCCKKTGYSVSHIRKMFVRHFGIDPGEYRQRKKLERVFSLMSAGNMSLKEVAGEIGMKNVTHLNLFIRKRCNMTPGELYRNFRNKKSFPELIL